jgi:hypothetical protein
MLGNIPSELLVAVLGLLSGVFLALLNRKPSKASVAEIYSSLHDDLLTDLKERKIEVAQLRNELNVVNLRLITVERLLRTAVFQMTAAGLPTDGIVPPND